MPNWCMNKLTVSGNAAELKRFVESSMGFPAHYPPQEWEKLIRQMDLPEDTPYFCFNAHSNASGSLGDGLFCA